MPHSNIKPQTRKRARQLRSNKTRAEAIMWNLLRQFKPFGARFRRETPIGPYIADFAWLSKKIIVEVDGDSHFVGNGPYHDGRRDNWLHQQGYKVLRFTNSDILESEEGVYLQIQDALGMRQDANS